VPASVSWGRLRLEFASDEPLKDSHPHSLSHSRRTHAPLRCARLNGSGMRQLPISTSWHETQGKVMQVAENEEPLDGPISIDDGPPEAIVAMPLWSYARRRSSKCRSSSRRGRQTRAGLRAERAVTPYASHCSP
jgi:hypothetical protein